MTSYCTIQGSRKVTLRGQGLVSPEAKCQILNIFIIHIERSYAPSVLKYYNEVFFNVLHEEIRSIKSFQIEFPLLF